MQYAPPKPVAAPSSMLHRLGAAHVAAWSSQPPAIHAALARVWANVHKPAATGGGAVAGASRGGGGGGGGGGAAASAAARASGSECESMSDEGDGEQICIELARSNRSTCRTCQQLIARDTPRLGVTTNDDLGYTGYTMWHHHACFDYSSHAITSKQRLSSIPGFSSLTRADCDLVEASYHAATRHHTKSTAPASKRSAKSSGHPARGAAGAGAGAQILYSQSESDDDVCEECGQHNDDCECEGEECEGCGQHGDECECEVEDGEDDDDDDDEDSDY